MSACLLTLAIACDNPTASKPAPAPLDVTIAVTPDSVQGWDPDTVRFRLAISGPDSDSVKRLLLSWTIADEKIASFARVTDSAVDIAIRGDGSTTVTAAIDSFTASAILVGRQEGAVLAEQAVSSVLNPFGSPALDEDGNIYLAWPAVSAFGADLAPLWTVSASSLFNPAVGPDGVIYFSASQWVGAASYSGALLWQDTTNSKFEMAPAIDALGSVYIPGRPFSDMNDWSITRYDAGGAIGVRMPWPGHTIRVPVIVDDTIVVAADLDSQVFAHTRSGQMLWVDTLPSKPSFFWPSAGSDGRTVYMPTQQHVVALDGVTGTRKWEWLAPFIPVTPIVDGNGSIYVQGGWGMTALTESGTVQWVNASIDGLQGLYVGGAPALAEGGVLYAVCDTDPESLMRALCAVNTADGSVRWRRSLPLSGYPGTILILPDSSILFYTIPSSTTDTSRLVKLRGRFPLADAPWPVEGGDLQRTRRGKRP